MSQYVKQDTIIIALDTVMPTVADVGLNLGNKGYITYTLIIT